jgi:hypothetical protein
MVLKSRSEPGQNLFIKRGAIHSFMNLGDERATCLSILTPGILGPEYFREMPALTRKGSRSGADEGDYVEARACARAELTQVLVWTDGQSIEKLTFLLRMGDTGWRLRG